LANVRFVSTIVLIVSATVGSSSLGAHLLGHTRLAILALLLDQPERKLYLRQIVRLTGAAQGGVQRELDFLVRSGILLKTREGNLAYFQANRTAPIFEELCGLVRKTAGLPELLLTALLPHASLIKRAFVYGSVARGEEGASSDVDLMVIGDVSFFDVVAAVSPLQQTLGREINPTVFDFAEYARRLRAKDSFLTRVEKQPRIDLIGGSDVARSVALGGTGCLPRGNTGGDRGPLRSGGGRSPRRGDRRTQLRAEARLRLWGYPLRWASGALCGRIPGPEEQPKPSPLRHPVDSLHRGADTVNHPAD